MGREGVLGGGLGGGYGWPGAGGGWWGPGDGHWLGVIASQQKMSFSGRNNRFPENDDFKLFWKICRLLETFVVFRKKIAVF